MCPNQLKRIGSKLLCAVVEEHEAEEEEAEHHAERAGVVWVGCWDKPLVLRVQ
jgi:hypothetical protein